MIELCRWFAEELEPLIEEHVCKKEVEQQAEPTEEEQEEVVEEIIPRSPKMDTDGKPIGKFYLEIKWN